MGAGNAERYTCLNNDYVLLPSSDEMDYAVDTSHMPRVLKKSPVETRRVSTLGTGVKRN